MSDVEVVYVNESNKKVLVSPREFMNQWTGVSLIVEKNSDFIEPGYKEEFGKKEDFKLS
ncbi:hypothetical protein [Anditalea andensis]|uniref:hypothetical protein n=1 Tax=Anditalea andensis TaxID=1048983 RepID=UPI0013DF48C2|nr:hypothetical protein [Anditalea andensis]